MYIVIVSSAFKTARKAIVLASADKKKADTAALKYNGTVHEVHDLRDPILKTVTSLSVAWLKRHSPHLNKEKSHVAILMEFRGLQEAWQRLE